MNCFNHCDDFSLVIKYRCNIIEINFLLAVMSHLNYLNISLPLLPLEVMIYTSVQTAGGAAFLGTK